MTLAHFSPKSQANNSSLCHNTCSYRFAVKKNNLVEIIIIYDFISPGYRGKNDKIIETICDLFLQHSWEGCCWVIANMGSSLKYMVILHTKFSRRPYV